MNYTGADLTGGEQKHSATNPKSVRRIPTRMEDLVDKAIVILDEEIHTKPEPLPAEKIQNLIANRHFIVDEALRQNNKISKSQAARMLDVILNKKIDLPTIKKFAVLDTSGDTVAMAEEVFEDIGSTGLATVEAIECLAAVCKAVIHWVMVHHSEKYSRSLSDPITPFIAWRLKEAIQSTIKSQPMREIEPRGFDNDKNVHQFRDNLNVTDLVLWNDDIWLAAIRGCESFVGTPVTKDLLKAITPMFWMFEKPVSLNDKHWFDIDSKKYACVGFVIMPTMEDFVQITFPEGEGVEYRPDPNDSTRGVVIVDDSRPEVRAALDEARKAAADDSIVKFSRQGFFVAIIFLPTNGEIAPQARFLKPLFEDDDIPSGNGMYSIILAATKFLTLKYVATDTVSVSKKELKADRALFKQVRHGKVTIPPIKVINLRRPEVRTRKEANSDGTPKEKRNWSCHWFVDPHWRQQFYPSMNRHLPIRILTFIKGDMSKPLKPPRQKVYKAVR